MPSSSAVAQHQQQCVILDIPRERKLVICLFDFGLFCFVFLQPLSIIYESTVYICCVFYFMNIVEFMNVPRQRRRWRRDDVHSRMKVCFWTTLFLPHIRQFAILLIIFEHFFTLSLCFTLYYLHRPTALALSRCKLVAPLKTANEGKSVTKQLAKAQRNIFYWQHTAVPCHFSKQFTD